MNGANLEIPAVNRTIATYAFSFLLAVLFCTSLRVLFLFIYPVFVIGLYYILKWKLDKNAIYLLIITAVCWLLSFREGFYLKYNLVSLYYFLPFLLMLFAIPQIRPREDEYFHQLMTALAGVMIINNIVGFFQYINHPFDDSFEGLYGTFTVSQNGLSLINSVLFFYYATMYQHRKKSIYLILALFFIVCSIMGFYGAGLIAFIGAVVLTFLRLRLKNIIALALGMIVIIGLAFLVMKIVSPLALDYNVNIIKKFLDPTAHNAPRKLIIFKNYFVGYTKDVLDLLIGSGPGTFNSRSAFMVGSPTFFNVDVIKSSAQPEYFRDYAYPLWNASNTGPYDGFMNQPFTSLLALLGEYGLLTTLAIVYVATARYKWVVKTGNRIAKQQALSVEFKLFKFCTILTLLLLVIDNYMEYPEIVALLLLLARLCHEKLRSAFYTTIHAPLPSA